MSGKLLKSKGIFWGVLAGMAAATLAHADENQAVEEALARLRAGGNIIVMRHATSPAGQKAAVGMTEGCTLAPGRGLSAQGFYEARYAGEWLAENGVRIDRTYTGDLCRSYDTARLVAAAGAGDVIPRPEMKSDDPMIRRSPRLSGRNSTPSWPRRPARISFWSPIRTSPRYTGPVRSTARRKRPRGAFMS